MKKLILAVFLTIGLLLSSRLIAGSVPQTPEAVRSLFEEKFAAWESWSKKAGRFLTFQYSEQIHDIQKMGLPVLPFLVEKLERDPMNYSILTLPLSRITKKKIQKDEWPPDSQGDSATEARLFIRWWQNMNEVTSRGFTNAYNNLLAARQIGDSNAETAAECRIQNLGIPVLPFLIEGVKSGEKRFIGIISKLTENEIPMNASPEQCIDWWSKHKQDWTIPTGKREDK